MQNDPAPEHFLYVFSPNPETLRLHRENHELLFFPAAIRIECISLNAQDPHHVTEDIMPDSTSADITGLHEKTDYLVRVMAVTEEYFDRLPDKHKHKKLHAIPRDVLVAQEESPWLPSASIIAKTAGTEAPANIRLSQSTMTSLVLTWTPPLVYGSNKLLSQVGDLLQFTW